MKCNSQNEPPRITEITVTVTSGNAILVNRNLINAPCYLPR